MRTTSRNFIARGISGAAGTCLLGGGWWTNVAAAVSDQAIVTVKPQAYPRALRNPLMGFRPDLGRRAFEHEYATLAQHYIKWNEIENAEGDGIERIRAFCNEQWKGVEAANIKVTRLWLPGDDWDSAAGTYAVKPKSVRVEGRFTIPAAVGTGERILALAVLDPAGNLPCALFSVANYFTGGRHPIGRIGVGTRPAAAELDPSTFDNPGQDRTLHYALPDGR